MYVRSFASNGSSCCFFCLFVSSTESLISELLVDAIIRPLFIFHMNFIQMDGFEWLPGRHKGQLFAKYSTILFLETRKGMEVVLYINIHCISLYMNSVFINILLLLIRFCCYGSL